MPGTGLLAGALRRVVDALYAVRRYLLGQPLFTSTQRTVSADFTEWHTIGVEWTLGEGTLASATVAHRRRLSSRPPAHLVSTLDRLLAGAECRSADCPSSSLSAQREDIQVHLVTIENAT